MNPGFYSIVTSDHLPDDKAYMVGGDIMMSTIAYRRTFGWDILDERVGQDFKEAIRELDRLGRIHG